MEARRLIMSRSHRCLKSFVVCALCLGGLRGAPGQNLLVNGGFEVGPPCTHHHDQDPGSTAILPWVVTVANVGYNCLTWRNAAGNGSLELNGGAAGAVAQTFETVAGGSYLVTFMMAGNMVCGDDPKRMRVSAAGQQAEFSFVAAGHSFTDMGWELRSWEFQATGSETTIEFQSLIDGPCGPAIDEVSVISTAPPGPPFSAEINALSAHCVTLVIANNQPIKGGEVGIAYDPSAVRPVAVRPGPDFPATGNIYLKTLPGNNCPSEAGVQAGFIVGWLNSTQGATLTPRGTHQLLKICFELAPGAGEGSCSPLRFVQCLGVPEAPVRNSVTVESGTSQTLATTDGEVCVRNLLLRRGDANGDGTFDVSDPIVLLDCLFLGGDCTRCPDLADANDDGNLDLTDPIYLLAWRFMDGSKPPPPFPECGPDPTRDDREDCEASSCP